jgi:hypothetical protein
MVVFVCVLFFFAFLVLIERIKRPNERWMHVFMQLVHRDKLMPPVDYFQRVFTFKDTVITYTPDIHPMHNYIPYRLALYNQLMKTGQLIFGSPEHQIEEKIAEILTANPNADLKQYQAALHMHIELVDRKPATPYHDPIDDGDVPIGL